MATFGEHAANDPGRQEKIETGLVSSGSMAWAIGGACAFILAIIGLASVLPTWMVTICTIIVGAAFLLEGIAIAGRHIHLLSRTGGTIEQTEMAGGMNAEFLAGCAGLALGIIGILGVYPVLLSACAVIIFGSALVFGSNRTKLGEYAEMYRAGYRPGEAVSDVGRVDVARTDVPLSSTDRPLEQISTLFSPVYGTHLMVGLATVALGICALAGLRPLVLSLVGLLVVSFTLFLSGTAVTTKFMYRLARRGA